MLSTKLEPPYQRPGLIERPSLVARLEAADSPMVAVIAPAGYGKSTILSQLGTTAGRSFAWLSADRRDADPATLVRDIAAAIDRVVPLPVATIASVSLPGPSIWSAAVPRIGAAFRATPSLCLVIDDADRIDEPEAMDVLLALLAYTNGTMRIVLGGRTTGRLPAPRLIASGLLTMFGREDLVLDGAETAAVLDASGMHLPPTDVDALLERTEGWAAGIYLSALSSARRRHDPEVISPVAPERLVEEYLRTEVLDALGPQDARLLLAGAMLDRMSGPLCDAVLDRHGSSAALDRLERTNLFLIPLDLERGWFRLHHLLGDFLRSEMERRDPAASSEIRRRAMTWHEEQGLFEPALEYAMAAGDEERAATLTVMLGQAALNAGRAETVRRWFGWFDDRAIARTRPGLAAYGAMAFALEGDTLRAERWADLADLDERGASASVADGRGDVGLRAISRVLLARDGVAAMVADGRTAMETVPHGDQWRIAALTSDGVARVLAGDATGGRASLLEAVARWDQTGQANMAATLSLIQLAAMTLEDGDRTEAEALVRKTRGILHANGLSEHTVAVAVDALDARLAMAHGAVELARADLAHAQRLRPRLGPMTPWLSLRARYDLIRVHLTLGDGGGARTLMAEVRDILTLRPDMGTLLVERDELMERLAAVRGGHAGASTLTMAELRVLPLLTTHLTFREIGERLFVSQNTVKTQSISIYRKLDATSRSEAIDRAVELGLLESAAPSDRFIPAG